jgi:phosphoglycerate dehydrogenase-like enzyme
MGHVGRAVARMAAALGMEVLPYSMQAVGGENSGAARTDFTGLLKRADVITVHCRLTDRTRRLIGSRELASMKARAFLVNTSRGGVVDEAALIEALKTGRIAGAGLDVYETEPLPQDSPLRALDNVILTPHTGGMPDGLRFHRKRYLFFVENIRRVSSGQAPLNALNAW